MAAPTRLFCTYEDRPGAFVGLNILLLSFVRRVPDSRIMVYSPASRESAGAPADDRIVWTVTDAFAGQGWNIKPAILLRALEQADQAFWIDTDIVVKRNLNDLVATVPEGSLGVGQEFRGRDEAGGIVRAHGWGMRAERRLPYHLNSGSVFASSDHRPLLMRWRELLSDPEYRAAQARSPDDRPIHQLGDQDVLWALLASDAFKEIPVHYFRNGRDVIQESGANGYHALDRLAHLVDDPSYMVHSLGKVKPWNHARFRQSVSPTRYFAEALCLELSAYVGEAMHYADALGNPDWLRRRTAVGSILRTVSLGHAGAQGLMFALWSWAAASVARRRRR